MRLIATIAGVCAAATLLAACTSSANSAGSGSTGSGSGSASSASKLTEGATFTLAMDSDPGNLDPQGSASSDVFQVTQFAYDNLISENAKGTIISGLASKWQVVGAKVVLTLHSGITCSDGAAFTAADAAANIKYVADPKNKSPFLGVFLPAGSTATASGSTLTISTPKAAPFVLNGLASLPMVCPKGMQDRKSLARATDGTGPYQLTQAVAGDHYTYTKRTGYTWGPGGAKTSEPGLPAKIVVKIVQNETTAANLLLANQLSAATIRGADTARLDAAHLFSVGVNAVSGEMWFNQDKGRPAADPAVRQALTSAVDLGQLAKVLTAGHGGPGTTFAAFSPTACPGNSIAAALPAHDLAKAKQELDAAGWKVGSGGVRAKDGKKLALTFAYNTTAGSASSAAAELAVQAWKQLGADVTAKGQDEAAINQTVFSTGNWDISWVGLNVSSPDQLVPFMSGPAPSKGTNFSHIDNSDYNSLVAKASAEVGTAGCPDWLSAESQLVRAADVIPFANQITKAYGAHTKFEIWGAIEPLTIRMLAS